MRRYTVLVVGLLALAGCRSEDPAILAKLDAPLRQKLEEIGQGPHQTLGVLGKTRGAIDEAMKQAIAATGATVLSADGDIFTARVSSERVLDLARLEIVTQLQLSQTAQPSSP